MDHHRLRQVGRALRELGVRLFLREHYIGEFNRRLQVASAQAGSAFVPYRGELTEPDFAD